jgi:glutamate synthase (NADPH/NADH) small chain
MEKSHIDRRVAQLQAEGVEFRTKTEIGTSLPAQKLLQDFDAVAVCGGAETPRDLPVDGRLLKGVHFAMEFLPQQNKVVAGDKVKDQILATGTSNRHGAASVTQIELLAQPPEFENKPATWPYWPLKLRTSSSQEEGCERDWSIATRSFKAGEGKEKNQVKAINAVRVQWNKDPKTGAVKMVELAGTEFEIQADLVLLAMGFTGAAAAPLIEQLGLEKDTRGNVRASLDGDAAYRTSNPKVFAAGDMRRGQSLVVWAIKEGRQCARAIDQFLNGSTELPL